MNTSSKPKIQAMVIVLIEIEYEPRESWRMDKALELVERSYGNVTGAILRIPNSSDSLKRTIIKR